jgi:hypothetical protein
MENEKSVLLSKFEKIRGYSSNMFAGEEWKEFDYFVEGYKLAIQEAKNALKNL